ncbi:MAG: hypothetical protein IPP12_19380 [Nitrospira sp.]|nr:hypothetical protein [Nitrospira sp.]
MNHIEVHEEPETKRTDKPKAVHRDQTENGKEPGLNQRHDAAASLRKRFLEASGQFYYRTAPGEPTKVAFTDHGKRLITEHDDPSVIHGMVLRAQEKGWTVVRVNGTDEFKTEAWVQATIAGLEVEGYTPRGIDLAQREDRREQRPVRRPTSKGHGAPETSKREASGPSQRADTTMSDGQQVALATLEAILRARGDSPAMITAAVEEARARLQGERVVVGTVVDHGIDHFEHDVQKDKSYFVKVTTPQGEREIWGVDLARACEQHDVQRGDTIALVQQAHERVTITVLLRDESGASIGTASQPATRNRGEVIKLDSLAVREQHQLKETARVGTQEPVVPRFDHMAARTDRAPNVTQSPALERTRGDR